MTNKSHYSMAKGSSIIIQKLANLFKNYIRQHCFTIHTTNSTHDSPKAFIIVKNLNSLEIDSKNTYKGSSLQEAQSKLDDFVLRLCNPKFTFLSLYETQVYQTCVLRHKSSTWQMEREGKIVSELAFIWPIQSQCHGNSCPSMLCATSIVPSLTFSLLNSTYCL